MLKDPPRVNSWIKVPLASYKNKKSQHLVNAEKIYKVKNIAVNKELAKKTGCSIKALNKIVKNRSITCSSLIHIKI